MPPSFNQQSFTYRAIVENARTGIRGYNNLTMANMDYVPANMPTTVDAQGQASVDIDFSPYLQADETIELA